MAVPTSMPDRFLTGRIPRSASLRGLDWFIFFLADVQTGFGPFIAVYLTTRKMDAGRDRLCAVDRRHHRPARADAGRRHRRCRAVRAAGGGPRGRDHRLRRAGLCGVADLSGGAPRPPFCMRWRAACWVRRLPRSVSAWSDRSRSASGSGATPRFASLGNGSPRPLMGTCRLFVVEPLGVPRHLHSGDPDLAGAGADPRAARSTSRTPMARSCARRPMPRRPAWSIWCASARC